VQWTYDLRGLDAVEWMARAGDDLGAHRAAGDRVLALVAEEQVAPLAEALSLAGYMTHPVSLLGMSALELVDSWTSASHPRDQAGVPSARRVGDGRRSAGDGPLPYTGVDRTGA
jgi:hypothetical protein